MTATTDIVPRVGHGFRLQWEPAQGCHVLLYPEGMVRLNQSAGEIIVRCAGDIVADLVTDRLFRWRRASPTGCRA